tara:strand:- start:80 stop:961 length:882 start_codon:yes stop_codon:yes gene_type:complete
MAILPFVDVPKINLDITYTTVQPTTGSRLTPSDYSKFRQGVSLRQSSDAFLTLRPFISSRGLPSSVNEQIDYSIDKTSYGQIQLFEDSLDDINLDPFEDIASLNNMKAFLEDSGITAYPQVMLSPGWLNPGMMNGIIEPLAVRGTIAGASIESPFVAHTVRAMIAEDPIEYEYFPPSRESVIGVSGAATGMTPFIDSAGISIGDEYISVAEAGISDFGTRYITPYNDLTGFIIRNDLTFQKESLFNDFIGVGIISKGISHTFPFESNRTVSRGETGIRNVTGVDSIAYKGLMN